MSTARRADFDFMDLDDFEDYLADKPRDQKWELIGGRVVKSMVGARWSHHQIVQNINFFVRDHIRRSGSPCRTFMESFWLKQPFLKLAVFPDVMVHCGPPAPGATSIDDPIVLFEVVSPGSQERDRFEKGPLYRRLTSLQHYVLVERDTVSIDLLTRSGDRSWIESATIEGLDQTVSLPAIGIDLPLSEIYRDVIDG